VIYLDKYDKIYDELVKVSDEIRQYYDIDKVKTYAVYIWTKGEHGKNVFDILNGEIMFYEEHEIIEEAKPIIEKIQAKLKEMEDLSVENKNVSNGINIPKEDQKWGVGCVIIHNHKMLLGRRCKPGDKDEWCFPGGSVEKGETVYDGVMREVFEEVSLTPYKVDLVASYHKGEYQDFLFVCDNYDGIPKPQEGEFSELKWVTVEEAYKLPLFPYTKDSLDIIVDANKKDNRFNLGETGYDRARIVENYYKASGALMELGTTKNIPPELLQLSLDASAATLKIINYINENK
jgi:ADP-ribose pyrophosphatase YjhB (NUDIX family)